MTATGTAGNFSLSLPTVSEGEASGWIQANVISGDVATDAEVKAAVEVIAGEASSSCFSKTHDSYSKPNSAACFRFRSIASYLDANQKILKCCTRFLQEFPGILPFPQLVVEICRSCVSILTPVILVR